MSEFFDPYNADRPLMMKCSCGRDHTLADHHARLTLQFRRQDANSDGYLTPAEFLAPPR